MNEFLTVSASHSATYARSLISVSGWSRTLASPFGAAARKIDLNAANQTNLLAEYAIHNLSDADYVLTVPAVAISQVLLSTIAPQYGYSATDVSNYNNQFRNPVLSYLSAERLLIVYGNRGLNGVVSEINKLQSRGVI